MGSHWHQKEHKKVKELWKKMEQIKVDPAMLLEGYLYKKPVNYWNYIQLDALTNLQHPETDFPDEVVFLVYHQMCELYFYLCIHELQQLSDLPDMPVHRAIDKIHRVARYFELLGDSFSIVHQGMDPDEFAKFRKTLAPASGLQSVQFRKIELMLTPIQNLLKANTSHDIALEDCYPHLYWNFVHEDGSQSQTLIDFHEKYEHELLAWAKRYEYRTLYDHFMYRAQYTEHDELWRQAMRSLDQAINIKWSMRHYQGAQHHLTFHQPKSHEQSYTSATGGSTWQRYLDPKLKKRIFFPSLWTAEELEQWGKN